MSSSVRGFASRGVLIAMMFLVGSTQDLPAQIAKGRSLTGHGTLDSSDGSRRGQWRAEFVVDADGVLSGSFRLDGAGGGEPGVANGTADDRQLSFAVTAGSGERRAIFQFEGKVLGTGVEGTFTGPRGAGGTWQGFCDEVGGPKPADSVDPGPIVISN